ncbi:MAG: T9SS type B sorting domain-containing protein [Algibacter sp.]
MFTNYSKNYLLFLLIICIGFKGFSQLSKTHYIPPLTFANESNATPADQYIYLSTPSAADVPYTITPVGQTTNFTGVVSNNNPATISIGSGSGQLFIPSIQTSTITNNKGYIIEAESTVYVSIRANAGSQAGALVSKGLSALGTTFRIGSFTNESSGNDYLSFVSVMATEDDTQVSFNNLPPGLIIENYTGTTPINITLNKSESYTIAVKSDVSVTNRDGLIGALVESNKSIVVNCGSTNGSFDDGNGRDYGIDQIAGLSKIGKEYIFVKGDGDNGWENALIVAHYDNTEIYVNDNTTPIAIINAGDYYSIEGNNYTANDNMYVATSQDVFAYQGVGGLRDDGSVSEANQGMFFVPPLSCEARGNIDNIAVIDKIGGVKYDGGITIVTTATATITINNTALNNQPSPVVVIGPSKVIGKTNPEYVTYKVTGLTDNVSIQGDDELYAAYFNYNGAATSGSFYSGFPSAPEINFDAQFATLGNCIPSVTLEAANTESFDSFKWEFDDGTGFQDLMITTPNLTPTFPATYRLIGIINCTGNELKSVEIPVSLCPDDSDNDGIIDNIDIDNDNDGILNCTESKGDVTINIANTSSPQLIFQDASTNSSIVSGVFSQTSSSGGTNDFIGDSNGNFTSTVDSASDAEGEYTLSFTELINFSFSENTATPHNNTDGEFFIAKISPANKNITLVDPDNRLLVDTNFDGVFETGVAITSGSEIHFKINPSPTGNTEYQFLANQVDGFSFIHKLANVNASSTFNGTLSLTCYKNDNDSDGIEDAFDLDSDNDGIPDFIENTGILQPLSGIDADLNGLDDIYDINALPIDTDSDLVPDYYDLDSDNDGIYDIVETGILTDSNSNGIVDTTLFGTNGWIDTAETSPDSNEIGYTIDDLDTDGIFSYIDSDSDGDLCSDVIEAGFIDANKDDYLDDNDINDSNTSVNNNGLVTGGTDGYNTLPNVNYKTFSVITITTQPLDTPACLNSDTIILIETTGINNIQWEVSTDNGLTWNTASNGTNYSNVTTTSLNILNTPSTFNNYQYRAFLEKDGNSCGIYSDAAILTVNGLPLANVPNIYNQCDDISNNKQANFNLTLDWIKEDINPNYIADNLTFTYFDNEIEANNNGVSILDNNQDPTNYFVNLNTDPSKTIWIRVENQNSCASVVPLSFNISISSLILDSYVPPSIYKCEDGQNSMTATFDMTDIKTEILNNIFPALNVTVHFYESETDAGLEINEILDIANHKNPNSSLIQSIWVRVKSDLGNACLGLKEFPNLLIVEALPTANPVTIARQCAADNSDSLINYPFDTLQIEGTILGTQNPADVTIKYYAENGTSLPSPLPNPFLTETQTITVIVENNSTLPLDAPCSDFTTLEFIVDEQPVANPVTIAAVCDGDNDDVDDDGLYPFDLSTVRDDILGTQSTMEIYFNYIDETGNTITNAATIPDTLISGNQTITVEVINPINTSCTDTTSFDLIVNPLPDFSVDSPRIVCTSDPTFSIDLDVDKASVIDFFTYEWLWTSLDGTITDQFISNDESISVSTPGTYSITLTKTDGTGCPRTREILVDASEKATITQDDVTIIDISKNNSVTIDTTTLGSGNYEFALSEEGSNFITYQDEPFFENVKAGFYTIYVNDPICGFETLPISVIGHAKYFTPNGDGDNDYWLIKGIGASVQPNSNIIIYDRYGKLLKQISPLSPGWDGVFNGQNMPSDDYWFRVLLQDGREFMGHFALKR